MKISAKGLYSLKMLLDLAEHRGEGFVALRDIADRQGISKKYLEQVASHLNHAGLLLTNRGSQGGYKLAKSPDKYTVGYILSVTESSIASVELSGINDNSRKSKQFSDVIFHRICNGLTKVITDYLDNITLQDILDKNHEQETNNYYI
ncbi:MAG: Rrf2 family transcriptional regulator [Planctomycetaceae bacterium]|jgi:Rrf2 family protein|nr:Rrf2 family transcriptional regulator [Planctomycetaceae bacterium]